MTYGKQKIRTIRKKVGVWCANRRYKLIETFSIIIIFALLICQSKLCSTAFKEETPTFVSPWKMTFGTSNTDYAVNRSKRYLGAKIYSENIKGKNWNISWVAVTDFETFQQQVVET